MHQIKCWALTSICLLEHVLRIKELGIELIRSGVVLAHYKDLSRLVTRGLWLGGVNLEEEENYYQSHLFHNLEKKLLLYMLVNKSHLFTT